MLPPDGGRRTLGRDDYSPRGAATYAGLSDSCPRTTGDRILIDALERRGNRAEALRAYERLRILLREELGISPSPALQAVHERLLRHSTDG